MADSRDAPLQPGVDRVREQEGETLRDVEQRQRLFGDVRQEYAETVRDMETKKSPDETVYICPHCEAEFAKKQSLSGHLASCRGDR